MQESVCDNIVFSHCTHTHARHWAIHAPLWLEKPRIEDKYGIQMLRITDSLEQRRVVVQAQALAKPHNVVATVGHHTQGSGPRWMVSFTAQRSKAQGVDGIELQRVYTAPGKAVMAQRGVHEMRWMTWESLEFAKAVINIQRFELLRSLQEGYKCRTVHFCALRAGFCSCFDIGKLVFDQTVAATLCRDCMCTMHELHVL